MHWSADDDWGYTTYDKSRSCVTDLMGIESAAWKTIKMCLQGHRLYYSMLQHEAKMIVIRNTEFRRRTSRLNCSLTSLTAQTNTKKNETRLLQLELFLKMIALHFILTYSYNLQYVI